MARTLKDVRFRTSEEACESASKRAIRTKRPQWVVADPWRYVVTDREHDAGWKFEPDGSHSLVAPFLAPCYR